VGDRSAVALAGLAAALAAWPTTSSTVRRRVRRLSPAAPARPRSRRARRARRPLSGTTRRWLFAGAAGTAVAVVVGGGWAPFLGVGAALAVERLLFRAASRPTEDDERLIAELPLACDLLAVCLEAGVPPGVAIEAVAGVSPHPLGETVGRVAALYRLGAEPAQAWTAVPPPLEGLARAFVRAGGSGSSVVPALRSLSADLRASLRNRTEVAARQAGVWVLAPLGACFLPAFLCLGVVPLVLGIAHGVFG
jgi:Flp pilus assembly protein TadB